MRPAARVVLIAALSIACSGKAEPKPDTKYLTVFVAKDGAIEVDGREASLIDLENALKVTADTGAVVLFVREPSERDRAAHGMMVLQTIRSRQVPVRFCRNRDFSDAIGPDGKLLPQ